MVSQEMDGIVMIMEDSELGKLAKTVYNQEGAFMDGFNSELAYANYQTECYDANKEVVSLLERCNEFNVLSKKWSEITEAPVEFSELGESPTTEQCRVEIEGPQVVNSKDAQDCLRQAIDRTMERLKNLLQKNWGGLLKELEDEAEVAYAKFINLRKKFYGNHISELIKTSQGNRGGELIKTSQGKQGGELIKTSQGNQGGELIKTSQGNQGGELTKTSQGNQASELTKTSQGNQRGEIIKAKIAEEILGHVKYGINIGLQCDRNCRSRRIWVSRIAKDFEMLVRELEGLDVRNEKDRRHLDENVSLFEQRILEYGSNCGNGSDQGNLTIY